VKPRLFWLNYDTHGKRHWCITTFGPKGHKRYHLTKNVYCDVLLTGDIQIGRKPSAVLTGYGRIIIYPKSVHICR
jgi:hypothetical protein